MNSDILTICVGPDKDYSSINSALNYVNTLPDEVDVTINLAPGTYKERLEIKRNNLTLIGDSSDNTKITYDLYAFMLLEDGEKRGTFRSYSVLVDANNFTAKNITFENSSGDGRTYGQALAMYAEGDLITFENCAFLGCQDTIFTGPLPPKEIQPGGFAGPKQYAPRINGRQYYKNCFIRGDIDFIFGSSTAYFEGCEIFSNNRGEEINGYVTAPSTPESQRYGYVFEGCKLTSDCPAGTVYLGRPWRHFAQAVFLNCELGAHIHPAGFHDWNKADSHETTYFAEYNNYGSGAEGERASFVHKLTDEEAKFYSKELVLGTAPDARK